MYFVHIMSFISCCNASFVYYWDFITFALEIIYIKRKEENSLDSMCYGIVSTDKPIEQWLNNILDEMQETIRYETKKAIYRYGREREKFRTTWIMEHLGMVCVSANQTW